MFYKKYFITMLALSTVSVLTSASEIHWGYAGETGPENWGKLSQAYASCHTGKQQSPIDITTSTPTDLPALTFDYQPMPLIIENNGRTTKITADKASSLKIGETAYKLLQFHIHTPSEGAINGKRADMVIHLVHQNAENQLAVVAVFLEKSAKENTLINTLWQVMPKVPGEPQQHETQIDINQLLPDNKGYYTYEGSLTTPPCTEGVKWIILKQPLSISAEQLAQYQALYPHNARPIQPLNDREVLATR